MISLILVPTTNYVFSLMQLLRQILKTEQKAILNSQTQEKTRARVQD